MQPVVNEERKTNNDYITYQKTKGVVCFRNENEIILRKGIIHKNELVIDRQKSLDTFIVLLDELLENNEVSIEKNHIHYQDFQTLYNYGFIRNKIQKGKTLILIENSIPLDMIQQCIPEAVTKVRSDIISDQEMDYLSAEKDFLKHQDLMEKFKIQFSDYTSVYYISPMSSVYNIQTFNRLMYLLDHSFFMALFDNENFFLFGVEPKLTGCYECLEKKLLAKLNIHISGSEYESKIETDISCAELLTGLGLIRKNIEQTETNEFSMLMGSVLYFYFPNFEYSFDFNRRTILCNTCAGINEADFTEQNTKSVNIIKEFIHNEN